MSTVRSLSVLKTSPRASTIFGREVLLFPSGLFFHQFLFNIHDVSGIPEMAPFLVMGHGHPDIAGEKPLVTYDLARAA